MAVGTDLLFQDQRNVGVPETSYGASDLWGTVHGPRESTAWFGLSLLTHHFSKAEWQIQGKICDFRSLIYDFISFYLRICLIKVEFLRCQNKSTVCLFVEFQSICVQEDLK